MIDRRVLGQMVKDWRKTVRAPCDNGYDEGFNAAILRAIDDVEDVICTDSDFDEDERR